MASLDMVSPIVFSYLSRTADGVAGAQKWSSFLVEAMMKGRQPALSRGSGRFVIATCSSLEPRAQPAEAISLRIGSIASRVAGQGRSR
ncbi:MAG: hypothetical protein AB7O57_19565, partial [Hyphomicrobiaceae bacterium]